MLSLLSLIYILWWEVVIPDVYKNQLLMLCLTVFLKYIFIVYFIFAVTIEFNRLKRRLSVKVTSIACWASPFDIINIFKGSFTLDIQTNLIGIFLNLFNSQIVCTTGDFDVYWSNITFCSLPEFAWQFIFNKYLYEFCLNCPLLYWNFKAAVAKNPNSLCSVHIFEFLCCVHIHITQYN